VSDKLNPFQAPETTHEVLPDQRTEQRVTVFDWGLALFLAGFASAITVIGVFFGATISLMASASDRVFSPQFETGLAAVGVPLCLVFALAVGYSAGTNYLAYRIRQTRSHSQVQRKSVELKLGFVDTVLQKTITLDKVLAGCFSGLFSAFFLAPAACFLMEKLSKSLRLTPDQTAVAILIGFVGSIVAGMLIGWYRWRRVSRGRV